VQLCHSLLDESVGLPQIIVQSVDRSVNVSAVISTLPSVINSCQTMAFPGQVGATATQDETSEPFILSNPGPIKRQSVTVTAMLLIVRSFFPLGLTFRTPVAQRSTVAARDLLDFSLWRIAF
jgi:hypothetical protein